MLEFLVLTEKLVEYNFHNHVPNDVKDDLPFLPPENHKMQSVLNELSEWTNENLMQLNEDKSNYIIFTRTKQDFNTRLNLNSKILEKTNSNKTTRNMDRARHELEQKYKGNMYKSIF